jgi:hypothetical protein
MLSLGGQPLSTALAQTASEFDELSPGQLPDCPRAIETKFPKCAIAMLVTTDEKWVSCYCKSNVTVASEPTFPDPQLKRRSAATFEKLVPRGGGPDPCALLTIGGRKQYVCW